MDLTGVFPLHFIEDLRAQNSIKYFDDWNFIKSNKTFFGDIKLTISSTASSIWKYRIIFDANFESIIGGEVVKSTNGHPEQTNYFSKDGFSYKCFGNLVRKIKVFANNIFNLFKNVYNTAICFIFCCLVMHHFSKVRFCSENNK